MTKMPFRPVLFLFLLLITKSLIAVAMVKEAPAVQQCLNRPLRVMTINVAHGRKDRFHQALIIFRSTIRSHLDEIADLIRRESPDVVALQEADGSCWWSGRLDHVQYIADKADMPYCYRGTHMRLFFLSYGTAILSKLPLVGSNSVSFPSSWPTPPKGFVVSSVQWNGTDVDVVSLHLDFLRTSVQREQVGMLVETLSKRKKPLIVMGDFNCDWGDDTQWSPIQMLCEQLQLKAYRPKDNAGLESYESRNPRHRLDWILISATEGGFLEYFTVPEVVSDHLAILSDIRLTTNEACKV